MVGTYSYPVRLMDLIAPPRLGRSFRWLLSASVINNLGDGIALAAGPLLIASLTHDPLLVAMAPLMRQIPFVVLGLGAGVYVDRMDRRQLVVLGDLVRAVIVGVLALVIATGHVTIGAVLLVMLGLGVAETFVDTASRTLMPSVVPKADLGLGNSRIMGAFLTANQFVGPPVGAFLLGLGLLWPFSATAICYILGALLISRMVVPRVVREPAAGAATVWHDLVEGLRWLAHHNALRTLALTILLFNVTWSAAWGVLVLWARDRIGLDEVGFGLITTVTAVGGLLGTASYGWVTRHVSEATVMRVCLSLEVSLHLVMAVTRSAVVAYVAMFVFGVYAFIWWTVGTTIQQRAVPPELQGRVGSVYMMGVQAGMVVGMPLGGLLARTFGLTAPNWFAFVGSLLTLAVIWRSLDAISHAGEH